MQLLRWSSVCLVGVLLLGCGEDRPDFYEEPLEVVGPLAVHKRFVYLDQSSGELVFVSPEFDGAELVVRTHHIDVGERPLGLQSSEDGRLVVTINGDDQTLSVVDVVSLVESRFELPSDYDAVTIGPNGRFLIAHYEDASAGGAGDSVFRNANEITIFDLDPDGEGGAEPLADATRSVISLRSSPLAFDFAPIFEVDGMEHHVLVVHAVSALTLVDMTATDEINRQRRIFFVPEDSTERLIPRRVLFTEDDTADDFDMKMFVLTSNAQDIFEVSILPPLPTDEADLALSINQFPAGRTPVEMAYYTDRQGDSKLLVLNGSSRELVIVDVETGNTTELDIDWTISQVLQFELANPTTGAIERGALLYAPSSQIVVFVDLETVEDRGTRALTSLVLSRPVQSIEMLPVIGTDKAIVVHSGSTALSVLNLARHFDIPLPGSATLRNVAFSPTGDRLFTTVAELPVLAAIELENGHPSQIDIPDPGGPIAVLADPQVILVDHEAVEGRMTLINGVDPRAETSLTVEGLFFEGLLERGPRVAGGQ